MRSVYGTAVLPFASLHCFDKNGKEIDSCDGSNGMSVQSLRYKRTPWAKIGQYSVYFTDFNSQADSAKYLSGTLSSVARVVTGDRYFEIRPPNTEVTCNYKQGFPADRYWLAFQQDAGSGRITINNQLLCDGQPMPGETTWIETKQPIVLPSLIQCTIPHLENGKDVSHC